MDNNSFSRRQFLKGSGALIVSFSLFAPLSRGSARAAESPSGAPDPKLLDSWLAISRDGTVIIFTSKVDLGTGIETALAQIVAEELDVPFNKVKMEMGDSSSAVDQGGTGGSRTIERAGPQLRQAAAAARLELLKLAASAPANADGEAHNQRRRRERGG